MKKSSVRARTATKTTAGSVATKAAAASPRATQKPKLKSSPQVKSSPKVAGVSAAKKVATGKVAKTSAPPEQPAARATWRVEKAATTKSAPAVKSKSAGTRAKDDLAAKKTEAGRTSKTSAKTAEPKPVTTKKIVAAKKTETVKKAGAGKKVVATKVKTTNTKATATAVKATAAKSAGTTGETGKSTVLRATKKRAPKDLALQYGEKVKAPRAAAAKASPRKRRDAAMRAKLQQVIAPDDGLLLRLARAGVISSSLAPEGSVVASKPLRATKPRRSRKWETRCGKCGVSAQYVASAALCVKCGAILVRD